jgi:iron(III) transport system substrate-binding protein
VALVDDRGLGQVAAMRLLVSILLVLLSSPPALAEPTFFPAHDGNEDAPVLVVYSALDEPLAKGPMIEGFQEANPDCRGAL